MLLTTFAKLLTRSLTKLLSEMWCKLLTVTLLLCCALHVDQTEDQVPPPVEEGTAGVMKQDEDEDVEMEDS